MSLRVGIVGLPNVGKSTLFNALLKKRVALSANYPFATVEPNTGVVSVPDSRLERLAQIVKDEEKMDGYPPIVPAVVEFVDIAGLVKGASEGQGLGNQFLSHIREVDAIIHVLRDFEDDNIIRAGAENPDADKLTIETELAISDLQTIEKLVLAQEKSAKVSKDALDSEKYEILKRVAVDLNSGRVVIGNYQFGDERLARWFKTLPLLSIKPSLSVYNVAEGEYSDRVKSLESGVEDKIVISAKLEEEFADLSDVERKEYLLDLGIEETGLERLIKKAYHLLGLISFLTAGRKEVRAWTLPAGSTAVRASGVIHTDFMKGFIRAQVVAYDKLIEAGSMKNARDKGLVRTEGKEYTIKDGDVVEFLISN